MSIGPVPTDDRVITLRAFLVGALAPSMPGAPMWALQEAVASTARDFPDWPPLDERRTMTAWRSWAALQ